MDKAVLQARNWLWASCELGYVLGLYKEQIQNSSYRVEVLVIKELNTSIE